MAAIAAPTGPSCKLMRHEAHDTTLAMNAGNSPVLLISDDEVAGRELALKLDFLGESAICADTANWRGRLAESSAFEVVLLGACATGAAGGEARLLADLETRLPRAAIVLLAGEEIPESAAAGLRARIFAAPGAAANFRDLLDALHKARLCHEYLTGSADADISRGLAAVQGLIGTSPAIQRIREIVARLADSEVNVLITGESGTGKEIVARSLHRISGREDKPFVPVNCGAIPGELLESELFGHERGAFTGAVATTSGRFERAHGGTLFLDEIGDMPLGMQVKLLRVLEEESFEKVGGVRSIHADVRILTATHKNLEEMIANGEFREDLYYRINVFPIEMPPLRERVEDVPSLLNGLIRNLETAGKGSVRFNSAAIECLRGYAWPGNVRELANLVERMSILYPHGIVGVEQLPERFRAAAPDQAAPSRLAPAPPVPESPESPAEESLPADMPPFRQLDLKQYLANLEKEFIERALQDSGGVVKHAAERLQLRRTTLVEKMRRHRLTRDK